MTPEQAPHASAPMMADSPSHIVVIDDSRASVTMYERAAEPLTVSLVSFESPLEGFTHLQNNNADLISPDEFCGTIAATMPTLDDVRIDKYAR